MHEDILKRVEKIEDEHDEFKQLLRDFSKDFHTLTDNFTEVKNVLKELSKSTTDLALFRQEFSAYKQRQEDKDKVKDEKIESIETTLSRLNWMIISSVVAAILALVIKGT